MEFVIDEVKLVTSR